MAVLTSGELAIESATRLAERADVAPLTRISTNFRAPSPSLQTRWASSSRIEFSARLKPEQIGYQNLHATATRGWAGTRAAWLCIVGFAAVLFNFGVVNVFFTGLHSYSGL